MNIKKLTAAVLASSMLMSASAFAYTDFEDTDSTRLLSAFGIMSGYDENTFAPNDYLTRSQVVKIVVSPLIYGEGGSVLRSGGMEINDVDVNNWAYGYWQQALNKGIINGFGDGGVHPDENVTYAQLAKMLVVAVGYSSRAEGNGGYPLGYVDTGSRLRILDNETYQKARKGEVPITRKEAAEMMANALNVPLKKAIGVQYNDRKGAMEFNYEECDGLDGRPYTTLIEEMGAYRANVSVKSVDGGYATLKINSSKNFENEKYDGSENKEIKVSLGNLTLENGKEYDVIIEPKDGEYNLKFVY